MLHGLGRTSLSLAWAERRLRRAGFRPVNIGYPSRKSGIPDLARHVADRIPRTDVGPTHFLAHSLGGILVRYLHDRKLVENTGRVVMLAPPNQGSQLAERLRTHPLYRLALGPAGQQLGTDDDSVPLELGPVDFELGVIVGNRPFNPLTHLIAGENDGLVAVDEARVEGMADLLVVNCGHTFIMNDSTVLEETIHFFEHGRFRDRQER
jgi:pimeloyl-ACP methyl ester carboxylesterase